MTSPHHGVGGESKCALGKQLFLHCPGSLCKGLKSFVVGCGIQFVDGHGAENARSNSDRYCMRGLYMDSSIEESIKDAFCRRGDYCQGGRLIDVFHGCNLSDLIFFRILDDAKGVNPHVWD